MYKLFLTLRYLRKRRIAYFAMAAVTLCVAMVLIVMSVMGGFLDNVKVRARGLLGDVIIDNGSIGGFPLYDEFIGEIRNWPEIAAATPVVYTLGLLRIPDSGHLATVQVVGVRLRELYTVNAFRDSLYYERHYPGTTTFDPCQQPLLKIWWQVTPDGDVRPARLEPPEPYASAFKQALAAGVVDEDHTEDAVNEARQRLGAPSLPGRFAWDPNNDPFREPPAWRGDSWPGLIIGREIVARRESDATYSRYYDVGELVQLQLPQVSLSGKMSQPITQPFRYVDDSLTKIFEIDSRQVYCDFDLLQTQVLMERVKRTPAEGGGFAPARCSQIQIKVRPHLTREQLRALTARLQALYRGYADDPRFGLDMRERGLVNTITAKTWEQSQEHMIAPIEKERALVATLFSIISLVAAVLVLCILYMIVLQKTRDIGIIKAIGGSSGGVALIFVGYGLAVGVVGSLLGTALGYAFVKHINEVQAFLTSINPTWQVWDRSVYSFDRIPDTVRTVDIVTVVCGAILASTLGSLLAAWRAGTMHPVEALGYE